MDDRVSENESSANEQLGDASKPNVKSLSIINWKHRKIDLKEAEGESCEALEIG